MAESGNGSNGMFDEFQAMSGMDSVFVNKHHLRSIVTVLEALDEPEQCIALITYATALLYLQAYANDVSKADFIGGVGRTIDKAIDLEKSVLARVRATLPPGLIEIPFDNFAKR